MKIDQQINGNHGDVINQDNSNHGNVISNDTVSSNKNSLFFILAATASIAGLVIAAITFVL